MQCHHERGVKKFLVTLADTTLQAVNTYIYCTIHLAIQVNTLGADKLQSISHMTGCLYNGNIPCSAFQSILVDNALKCLIVRIVTDIKATPLKVVRIYIFF